MNDAPNKFFTLLKIIFALILYSLISLCIYLASTPVIYMAWHCPPPRECNTPAWLEYLVFFILISPLPIFIFGAYLSRAMIKSLTQNKFLRGLIFFIFAAFPIFLLAALIVYIVNTP